MTWLAMSCRSLIPFRVSRSRWHPKLPRWSHISCRRRNRSGSRLAWRPITGKSPLAIKPVENHSSEAEYNLCVDFYFVVRYICNEVIDMPRPTIKDGQDRFQRYRANKHSRGMKLLRVWVPDPAAPGFVEEARRQAQLLRGAPEEIEAVEFIEAVANTEGWTD